MLTVPRRLAEITPEWATRALSARYPGARVSRVEIADVADGTNRRVRLRLAYAGADGGAPASVFLKLHGRPLHRLALLALRAWSAEGRLAASGVELPIEHPELFSGAWRRRTLASAVLMEDVTARGGEPSDAQRSLSPAEVRSGLAGLARLHAAFLGRVDNLPAGLGFLRPWRLGPAFAPVSYASLRRGMRRLEARQPSASRLLGEAGAGASVLERQFRRSALLAGSGSQTLLHGDAHPGNTYRLPGEETGFYDWQLVRAGHFAHDVGYFLIGALDAGERRVHEAELLDFYTERLAHALGHRDLPSDIAGDLEARYRAAPAFGLATWLHTLSAGTFQEEGVCLATVARFAAAYSDLGTRRSPLL